ncbi:RimK/LysX family protein [Methanobacterium sp.]|uniref:putative ATP-dependent zinc protease n=1 Tax=Methanobacterium sp. TaxID=2164 RepID=UPI0025EF6B5F|nr:RimK/LysX family protein [Methanobacterium sp.]MBI5459842.1 ATP-dependent zinc protease [Methanobacterium sp.]MDY9923137.1 RimK/LysX family protein [Methanobacterium sp.]
MESPNYDILDYDKLKKQLSFNLAENKAIHDLQIKPDAFIPVLFSLKFGGDWSFKTSDLEAMAVKEKITSYNDDKAEGYTLERVTLFVNPSLISTEGKVLRLEKCGSKNERELVERPFRVKLDAEDIILAELNPQIMEISLKRIKGPLSFSGSAAYGVSHEMEHLAGCEHTGKFIWEFNYRVEG